MPLLWQPVHPSHSPLRDIADAKVTVTQAPVYSGLALTCYHFGLNVMLDLEFPFGGTKGKTDVQYFVLEMAAYTPAVHSAEILSGRLFFIRKGVGFRVGIASWDVAFSAAATLAAVAASGSVKAAKTNIHVQAFGGDPITSLKIFQKIRTMDGLTPDTLQAIAMAGEEVADVLASQDSLEPKDLLVANLDVGVTEGWPEIAYSLQFGVESIFRRKSLLDAYRDIAAHSDKEQRKLFNALIPRGVYAEFGILNESEQPSQAAREEAQRILTLGR